MKIDRFDIQGKENLSIMTDAIIVVDKETEVIQTHPVIGRQILANITQTPHISDGAFYHHERYDGSGYPKGLTGNEIPGCH